MRKVHSPSGLKKLNDNIKWGPLGKAVYERTYARVKEDGSKETWPETVLRVVNGNCDLVDEKYIEENEREELFDLILNFKAIPGGRHLWLGGVTGRPFHFNCLSAGWPTNVTEHFTFLFDQLMTGAGVGTNYSNRFFDHINVWPKIQNIYFVCTEDHKDYEALKPLLSDRYSSNWPGSYTVIDSREGWVEALRILLNKHFQLNDSPFVTRNYTDLVFDFSGIRPKGVRIKTFGGVSSGPIALMTMLREINTLLNGTNSRLNSLGLMTIDHMIAKAVIAGNVRRSARLAIKSWKDYDIMDFINCKKNGTEHWTSNISVEIDEDFFKAWKEKDKDAKQIMDAIVKGMLKNGEPGFFNLSKHQEGELEEVYSSNPCGEISLQPYECCLTGDTQILTDKGYKKIEDLSGYETIVYSQYSNDKNFNSAPGYFKANVFPTGEKEIFKIKTTDGKQICATGEHPFCIVGKNKQWKTVKDLKIKDKLAIAIPDCNRQETFDFKYYMLGYLLGNGWIRDVSGVSVGICAGEQDAYILDIIKNDFDDLIIESGHDKNSSLQISKSNGVRSIVSYSKKVLDHLVDVYGFSAVKAPDKRLPSLFWGWDYNKKRSFIRGLWDSDGHIQVNSRKFASFCCSNIDMAKDMVMALNEFGICSKIYGGQYRPGRTQYQVKVNSFKELCNFYKSIYCIEGGLIRKRKALFDLLSEWKGKITTSWEFTTIKSIESIGIQKTYNMNVDISHNFIANGLVTHNCNLGNVNLAGFVNETERLEAFRLMTRFLIRATFVKVPYEEQRIVLEKNRRIGVGFFGFQTWLIQNGVKFSECWHNPKITKSLRKYYEVVRGEARKYSFQLRIPEPIKVTTVPPTGTTSLLCGETSGLQPIYTKYGIRRVRYADNDPALASHTDVEDCIYSKNTKVVKFWYKDRLVEVAEQLGLDENLIEQQDEIHPADMLAVQAMVQEQYTDNSISFTVNITPNSIKEKELKGILINYLPRLKGTTVMMDESRPQSPFERTSKEEYLNHTGEVGQGDMECKGACPIR